MIIGSLALTLRMSTVHSLKEKRTIVKSVIARLRNEFNVSVAEVAEQDRWQTAVIGVACVSGDSKYARQQLQAVVDWVYLNRPDVDVVGSEIELL
ncbi:MAG TPA: DUF503 domain-containing protein [Herpetosiphonaceae bacterium]|nr:DUF503 domain-containing protein [Herpetosiphonaceae bacterium]